jgi:hypothetical protein
MKSNHVHAESRLLREEARQWSFCVKISLRMPTIESSTGSNTLVRLADVFGLEAANAMSTLSTSILRFDLAAVGWD